jgi:CheY-like chemotaxis protein
VEACKNGDFDIIFMDLKKLVPDGIEATKQIKILNTKIPVIAISAHSEAQNGIECTNAGMIEYIEKPFTLEQIRDVITRFTGISMIPG